MVAVTVVGMVEMAVDEIANMIAVGDRFVAATRAVDVVGVVAVAVVSVGAFGGVVVADGQGVLVVVVVVGMVEVAVVQVVDVVVVADRRMTAVRSVLMVVLFVLFTAHGYTSGGHQMASFRRVKKELLDDLLDVFVAQRVVDVLTVALTADQARRI